MSSALTSAEYLMVGGIRVFTVCAAPKVVACVSPSRFSAAAIARRTCRSAKCSLRVLKKTCSTAHEPSCDTVTCGLALSSEIVAGATSSIPESWPACNCWIRWVSSATTV